MNKLYLIFSVLLLAIFFGLTIAAKYDLTTQIDFDTTVKLQDNIPQKLFPVLFWLPNLASPFLSTVLVIISAIIFRKRFIFIAIAFSFLIGVEVYGKYELQHPPPPQMFIKLEQTTNIDKYYIRDVSSYPSGHAARSALIAFLWVPFLISLLNKKNLENTPLDNLIEKKSDFQQKTIIHLPFGLSLTKENSVDSIKPNYLIITINIILIATLLGITLLVGVSKIYLGQHWFSDVLGGWLLGSGLALSVYVLKQH